LDSGTIPQTIPMDLFMVAVFEIEPHELFARLALNHSPPDFYLLSS
jgi:hypothetical protein